MVQLDVTWTPRKPRKPWWPNAIGALIILGIILFIASRNLGCDC